MMGRIYEKDKYEVNKLSYSKRVGGVQMSSAISIRFTCRCYYVDCIDREFEFTIFFHS